MSEQAIYLYGSETPTSYHDQTCKCSRHCRNCGYELEGRQRLYCSEPCGSRYRRELEFDRWMQSQTIGGAA